MGVYGTENFKTLLLLQFFMDWIQFIPATTYDGPLQKLCRRILNFAFVDFLKNFKIFNYIEVYGAEHFKTLLLLQFFMDRFQFISAITLCGPSQNLCRRILNLLFVKLLKFNEILHRLTNQI